MKTAISLGQPVLETSTTQAALDAVWSRLAAYVSLAKPRIVLMVLVTVGVGFLLGAPRQCAPGEIDSYLARHGTCGGGGQHAQSVDGTRRRRAHAADVESSATNRPRRSG